MNFQVIILQEKLEEKEKEIERVKKEMEVVSDVVVGDKKDEVDEIDEDAKEIDGGE